MELIKFYFIGLMVLVVAIMANFLAVQLGVKTWYDFLEGMGNVEGLNIKDILWLFVFYPLTLGGSAFLGDFIWSNFF